MAEKRTGLEALSDKCVWSLHDQSCKNQLSEELSKVVLQEMHRRFSDSQTSGDLPLFLVQLL